VSSTPHDELLGLLTRRQVLRRAAALALALPVLPPLPLPGTPGSTPGVGSGPPPSDATLQAFADTILPGRKATRTNLGNAIDPLAIAGVDPLPGAVEADALAVYHHRDIGFDPLEPAFLTELETRSLPRGADFLHLDFGARVQVCLEGLDFENPTRTLWEAAAAVPFAAFCAATLIPNATAAKASGYRVMGLPGTAPNGYTGFSYRRRLSSERTRSGSLP
jgi:hypothetical protein